MPARKGAKKGAKKATKKAAGKRGRSAVTGRYVGQGAVKKSPLTTINESTKKRGGKKRSSKKGRK